jgi:hypothetical protein
VFATDLSAMRAMESSRPRLGLFLLSLMLMLSAQNAQVGAVHDVDHARDARERHDARDSRETRDLRETIDSRDSRDVRESRDAGELRDSRDARELRETRDARETQSRDARDLRETRETQACHDIIPYDNVTTRGQVHHTHIHTYIHTYTHILIHTYIHANTYTADRLQGRQEVHQLEPQNWHCVDGLFEVVLGG